jgi:hypothetical protein
MSRLSVSLRRALPVAALLASVGLTSCIQDEVNPIVILRSAGGDTITADTISGSLNGVLTIISDVRDDQELEAVTFAQGYPDTVDLPIDYAAPIDLTNRKSEVFLDLSLPDSLYTAGSIGSVIVTAEDAAGNTTTVRKTIVVN